MKIRQFMREAPSGLQTIVFGVALPEDGPGRGASVQLGPGGTFLDLLTLVLAAYRFDHDAHLAVFSLPRCGWADDRRRIGLGRLSDDETFFVTEDVDPPCDRERWRCDAGLEGAKDGNTAVVGSFVRPMQSFWLGFDFGDEWWWKIWVDFTWRDIKPSKVLEAAASPPAQYGPPYDD